MKHGGMVTTKSRGKEPPIFSRTEQRAIVIEALGILPNVWQAYRCVGKHLGVSYGAIWNIAKSEGIKLIHVDRRWLKKRAGTAGYSGGRVKISAVLPAASVRLSAPGAASVRAGQVGLGLPIRGLEGLRPDQKSGFLVFSHRCQLT